MLDEPQKLRHSSESFFCRFTFGQFFAILVLEVFTLFFVFYLGARYGREFLGFDRVTAVADDTHRQERAGQHTAPTTADPEVTAMAHDLISQAKTPELKDRIAKMLGTDSRGKPLPSKTTEPVDSVPPPSAVQVVPEPVTPTAPPTLTVPAATIPSTGEPEPTAVARPPVNEALPQGAVRVKSAENARYSIQIGSYPQMEEANRAVERWKAKGYPAYMMIADIPDRGRWYRVRIGGFAERSDAQSSLDQMREREQVDALIVLNEQ